MSQRIYLGRGYWSIVDDHNFDLASEYNWGYDHGYARAFVRGSKNKKVYLHQLIAQRLGLTGGIDHRDRDPLNNLEENLRPANQNEQLANTSVRCTSQSGIKGVILDKRRNTYYAQITHLGKVTTLSGFRTPEAAKAARDVKAKELHGEFFADGS